MMPIILNESNEFEMSIDIPQEENEIFLSISDDLESAYQEISKENQLRIWNFIERSDNWLALAKARIKVELPSAEVQLLRINILSELDEEDLVFGIQFWVSEDREHGRGMKIRHSDLFIIDYGIADVALFN
ncbi:hypothetical protein [Taylorella equigenitalis]|nr:hypothetical protein [Taylorella equigenitalis]ASY39865.1 hypothetical protein CA604_07125 [Taylorella equigenitalis]WDU45844.1 hypothetical protein KNO33_04805 [Taylorella equigenitalis]WDU47705.1 hypothetical protein KNO30_06705 [Taylorella equigenitalis]WDU54665.1 hypothetical protein KPZ19_06805 [Taylorella equigenitalis]VEG32509.1 Uncharacterised protein [Taylorella equigenitalis ATCC 35865]